MNDKPTSCPACLAPIYHDPLDALFVRDDGAEWRRYECGARLVFHDAPPVHTEVQLPCSRAFDTSVTLRAENAELRERAERAEASLETAREQIVVWVMESDRAEKKWSGLVDNLSDTAARLTAELDAARDTALKQLAKEFIALLESSPYSWPGGYPELGRRFRDALRAAAPPVADVTLGENSIPFIPAALTLNILRLWDTETIEKFALHLLGDEAQAWWANRAALSPQAREAGGRE